MTADFGAHRRAAFAAPQAMRRLQERLLREHLAHCGRHSPFYRRRFREAGVRPDRVRLGDLAELPLTGKQDLERDNDAFLAVPPRRIVDIVLSSGTTGQPTRIMYTERDLVRLAYNEELAFAAAGLTAEDTALLTCTMDRCFVAGLAYFLGLRRLGCAVVRNGLASLDSHLEVIRRLDPTVLVGVPTFLRKLAQFLDAHGLPPGRTRVRRLVCIGEPLRDGKLELLKVGRDLQALWRARAYSTYASSETVTTFCECTEQCGGHLHPDLALVEIVDAGGRPLPPGAAGEVVVTPLAIEGMPLVRFRTGDISFLIDAPCACGRRSPRLGPILGRKQQMLKVRGTTLYPQAIYSVLDSIPAIGDYYVLVTSADELADEIAVHASVKDPACTAAFIQAKLQARLRVRPDVALESDEAVRQRVYTAASRKPIRFFDERKP